MNKLIKSLIVIASSILVSYGVVFAAYNNSLTRLAPGVDNAYNPGAYIFDMPANVSGSITQFGNPVGNIQVNPVSITVSGSFLAYTTTQSTTVTGSSNLTQSGANIFSTVNFTVGTTTIPAGALFYLATTSQIFSVSSTGQVAILSNNLVDANGNKYSTSTSGGGSGSGNGNLFVSPTSSVLANSVPYYVSAASSTVAPTSSIYTFANGSLSIGTSTNYGATTTAAFVGSATSSNMKLGDASSSIPFIGCASEYPTGTKWSYFYFQNGALIVTNTKPAGALCG